MRRLGEVLHISHRGMVIVRTDKSPPIGAEVVDKKVQKVGQVKDVFGPVKAPYVSVKPFNNVDLEKIVGHQLYLYRKRRKR